MTTVINETGERYSAYGLNPFRVPREACRAIMFCTADNCRCKAKKEDDH